MKRSYANVTATIALVLSLGGGAYAAITLSKNSVGSRELKPNAVRSGDIRNGGVKARDLAKGVRGGITGPAGPAGPQGPAGAPGATGPAGASAAGLVTSKNFAPYTATDNDWHSIGTMTWNQPAGTLDDVRGYISGVGNGADCFNNDTIDYYVLVDGREISADGDNGDFDGAGTTYALGGSPTQPKREAMAIEMPLEPAAEPAQHTLELFLKATCLTNPSPTPIVFYDLRLYVTRFG